MKVRELIEELKKFDPELEAVTANREYGIYHDACAVLTRVSVEKVKHKPGMFVHVFAFDRKRKGDVNVVVI